MEITGLISALVIGVIVGGLGRLVVPGRQKISMVMTLVVGIAAALAGTFAASILGVSNTSGIDWIELALYVVIGISAVIGPHGEVVARALLQVLPEFLEERDVLVVLRVLHLLQRLQRCVHADPLRLERRGGTMSYLKLLKLLYLADRRALLGCRPTMKRRVPSVVSLRNRPRCAGCIESRRGEPVALAP